MIRRANQKSKLRHVAGFAVGEVYGHSCVKPSRDSIWVDPPTHLCLISPATQLSHNSSLSAGEVGKLEQKGRGRECG